MIRTDQSGRRTPAAPGDQDTRARIDLASPAARSPRRRAAGAAGSTRACGVVLLASWCLISCSSGGDLVDDSENYEGSQAAAVAPVADRRSGGGRDDRLGAEVQQSIRRQLDQSGIFAGVVTLDDPGEGNEAEVIVEPALVGSGSARRDELGLKVRVIEKTNRKIVLDETYVGSGGGQRALQVAVGQLEEDLERRYGQE
jgi:hypothetical protein